MQIGKGLTLTSYSLELRTPLHGILGSAHLIKNSSLDSFQTAMGECVHIPMRCEAEADSMAIPSISQQYYCLWKNSA
jgi:hypothetical protein